MEQWNKHGWWNKVVLNSSKQTLALGKSFSSAFGVLFNFHPILSIFIHQYLFSGALLGSPSIFFQFHPFLSINIHFQECFWGSPSIFILFYPFSTTFIHFHPSTSIFRSAFGGPLLQGVPSVAIGERIEGQCFPLVYQPPKITFNSFQNPNFWDENKWLEKKVSSKLGTKLKEMEMT